MRPPCTTPPLYSVTRQARLKAPEPKGGRGNDPANPWYVLSRLDRHAPARRRPQHPHRPGTPGAPRRRPYDALPPCPEPGPAGVQSPADRMFLCSASALSDDIRYPSGISGSVSRSITGRAAGGLRKVAGTLRHPFGAGGPFPVIHGPTQSCNAVQATSRWASAAVVAAYKRPRRRSVCKTPLRISSRCSRKAR